MKLTINIPETLNEVTLKQYQKWLKIADGKELDSFLQQKMVEIFCNIPLKNVLQIKATDINNICERGHGKSTWVRNPCDRAASVSNCAVCIFFNFVII